MRKIIAAAMGLLLMAPAGAQSQPRAPQAKAKVTLTRLDCGTIRVSDLDVFSDSYLYPGKSKTLTDSCYLIRHGDQLMIWDPGLSADLVGKPPATSGPFTMSLRQTLVAQLAQLGVEPADVDYVGISHYHDDHTGQAASFPSATLLMGKEDFDIAKQFSPAKEAFQPWVGGGAKVEPVNGDKDVFGDGRVVILDMPGHTPGHHVLLVRLASGAVLLTGDQYHFTEQVTHRAVPSFNTDRAATLASHDRFDRIAANLRAKVIIQHEPAEVAKLPAFPRAAE